jgi:DNA-binding CsgD family transcriptional regulator
MLTNTEANARAKAADAIELVRRGVDSGEICDILGMRPHTLTAILRGEQIAEAAGHGRTPPAIAQAMHIHRRTVERALAARRGVPRHEQRLSAIAARRSIVAMHVADGVSSAASAQALDVSTRTIQSDRAALARRV